ncbi:LCP family protein [Rhodococcus gannanensis]|uniref:LCP family protein n=1 Tax=Rhodococcus gannanensis TaxID=1960308 RepID=A0ABW4NZ13_9NOCA
MDHEGTRHDDTGHDPPRQVGTGRKVRRRSRGTRLFGGLLLGVALVAVVLLGYVGYVAIRVAHTYNSDVASLQNAFPEEEGRPEQTEATNILLVGVDGAGAPNGTGPRPTTRGGNTDTTMLVHMPADRSAVHILSIMRDLWVPIPDHGFGNIDTAIVLGGPPLAVQTVEDLLHARIDHLVVVDLAGIAPVVEALGGIGVRSDRSFTSDGFEFVRGPNELDGAEAMRFVREQAAFPDSDFARVKNQHAVARGLTDSVFSVDTLTDPARLESVVDEIAPYVTVDSGLDWRKAMSLGYSLYGTRGPNHHYFTIPTSGVDTTFGGQSLVRPDDIALGQLRDALARDDVATLNRVGGG